MSFGQFKGRIIPIYLLVIMLSFTFVPILLLNHGTAHAVDGQVQSRSIQMGDSTPTTSGGTTVYKVTFTPYNVSATTIYGIIVDFCITDPIPGDSCSSSPLTGFSVTASGTIVSGLTGTWIAAAPNSGRTFEYTNATGNSLSSSAAVSFTINAVTNPTASAGTTFYARIFTFNAASGAGSATQWLTTANGSDNTNDYDYGGIALSTAQSIIVTSKVQEQLSFCVYVGSCGTQANVLLGDTHDVLSTTAPSTAAGATYGVFYSLSTNASHGAVVDLKGSTLSSGGNFIPAAGNQYIYNTTGTDFFGLCEYNSALTFGSAPTVAAYYTGTGDGSGTCAANTTDYGAPASLTSIGTSPNYTTFGFNATNTATTYGDQLASIASPGASVNAVVLAAGVNVTQASGVYTTTLQLIATGTY